MTSYGLNVPYFTPDEPILFCLLLVLRRRKQDLLLQDGVNVLYPCAHAFPRKKDANKNAQNCHGRPSGSLLPHNNVTITNVIVTKDVSTNHQYKGVDVHPA
jgi:hypothetical protein